MAHDPIAVWADMKLKTWPEDYWLIDIAPEDQGVAVQAMTESHAKYCCVIRDQTGFSLVIDDATWQRVGQGKHVERKKYGPLKVISTDSPLPFDVTGFIQAALKPINGAGFKAAPQCGLAADHFFTSAQDIVEVERIFSTFTASGKRDV